MPKPKRKPRPEELKHYGVDVKYKGKEYGLTVKDKVSDVDGVIESHFDYQPHYRPAGSKSRWNFGVGICLHKKPCKKCREIR